MSFAYVFDLGGLPVISSAHPDLRERRLWASSRRTCLQVVLKQGKVDVEYTELALLELVEPCPCPTMPKTGTRATPTIGSTRDPESLLHLELENFQPLHVKRLGLHSSSALLLQGHCTLEQPFNYFRGWGWITGVFLSRTSSTGSPVESVRYFCLCAQGTERERERERDR